MKVEEEDSYEQVKNWFKLIVLNNCPVCHGNLPQEAIHLWPLDKLLEFCARHHTQVLAKERKFMTDAIVWHEEEKPPHWKEYYITLQDGEERMTFKLIHSTLVNHVIAEPYTPPDINYTIHDSCNHEDDECCLDYPNSPESYDVMMAEKASHALDNLERQLSKERVIQRLLQSPED